MLATGQALNAAAERRARKELRSLLERAPAAPAGASPTVWRSF